MARLRRFRWQAVLTVLVVITAAVWVFSCEITHIIITTVTPEPIRSLPVDWSRVSVQYEVDVTFETSPQRFTVLVPAPVLDDREIPQVTRNLKKRLPGVMVISEERGTFYRLTEESLIVEEAAVAVLRVKIPERPTRWLFWSNPLRERFDLSRGPLPDGSRGHWFYVDSDSVVERVSIRTFLVPAYSLGSIGIWDDTKLELEFPQQGWTSTKGETGP